MKTTHKIFLFCGLAATVAAGCRKDIKDYDVPTTYAFENVSYAGQIDRMNMTEEMTSYMETARTVGTTVDASRLKDMFANQNNPFTFTSTRQLKNKCFLATQTLLEQWMDSLAAASTSTVAGAHGVAGVATSQDGTEAFLLSANGWDYTEMIEKGLMGAVFYYQATGVYLAEDHIGAGVDNETVTPGEGTDMQHHWDEAFGYLGAPVNFTSNPAAARFWGKASNEVNAVLGSNKTLMDAFLLGRAAIVNEDYETKDAQVPIIRSAWEKVVAAMVIHELNEAKTHLGDDALRNHEVSEAMGYLRALQFNPAKKITDSQLQSLLGSFGTDLYLVTLSMIDNARTTLAGIYGLESVKDQL